MPTSTTVNNLKINKLTKAQYDDIQNPSETELYLVEESIDTTPTSGSDNPISSDAVYTALAVKEDVVTIEAPVNATDATQPITSLTCVLNKYYRIDVPIETISITLPSMTNVTTIKTVTLYLTGGTAPDPQFASADTGVNVYFADGFEVQSGSTYEISCLWNGAAWIVASVTIVTNP